MNYKFRDIYIGLKGTLLCTLLFFTMVTAGNAQRQMPPAPPEERMEKLESMKIGFFTQRLDLTPEEAKKFWPVYNAFQDDLEKLRKGHRESLMDARNNIDKLTDKEIEK